ATRLGSAQVAKLLHLPMQLESQQSRTRRRASHSWLLAVFAVLLRTAGSIHYGCTHGARPRFPAFARCSTTMSVIPTCCGCGPSNWTHRFDARKHGRSAHSRHRYHEGRNGGPVMCG
ncbi:unnamed protein product, partial [Ectocarpus sp. 12 AP-2014]